MTTSTLSRSAAMQLSEPHPSITIYNTLTKRKEPFRTVRPGKVGVYLCGPTVYAQAHIGHMVGPVIFDAIKRYLAYNGFDVNWVVNITDVDDKLINKSIERGISMLAVAEENIADYRGNLAALGVDQIDHFPRATDCMSEIIALVEDLIAKGFAYEAAGDVYFDVARDPGYGKLSNRTLDQVQGDGGGGAERKRNAADFALWKRAKAGEPSWKSPWGEGRPGWHIECSAMSKKLLGETFDIHGGGLDLVFPHHENEIAQSECCHGAPFALYWAHNGLLRKDAESGKIGGGAASEKMSRSKGAGGLADLIAKQGGERIRFFLLRTHYRSTVLFSEEAIAEAGVGLDGFYRLFKRYARVTGADFYSLPAAVRRTAGDAALDAPSPPILAEAAACRSRFLAAMDDDFNTGGAVGELFELARLANKFCDDAKLEDPATSDAAAKQSFIAALAVLKELAALLGLFLAPPASAGGGGADAQLLGRIMALVIDLRAEARKAKNFAAADAIRDGLKPLGIAIEDRPGGAEWTGGDAAALDGVMQMLITLRADARKNKDYATGDAIRNRLADLGVKLEDRPGGAEWGRG